MSPGRACLGGPIVAIVYDNGKVERCKRDAFFLTRLAIGKVMKISHILRSIGFPRTNMYLYVYVCMHLFRQLKLSKELADMVLRDEISLESAQVIS